MSKKLLVGFSGCSCSGKSTTAKKVKKMLEQRGYKVYLVPEVAREILQNTNHNVSYYRKANRFYRFEKNIMTTYIQEIKNACNSDVDIILTDRTMFDILVYVIQFGIYLADNECTDLLKTAEAFFKQYTYDAIYIFEELELRDLVYYDGFRDHEISPILFTYTLINLMKAHGFRNYKYVEYTSVEKRAEKIVEDIEKLWSEVK